MRLATEDPSNVTHSHDGTVKLVLELEFVLKSVDDIEALTLVAKAEMNK
jgi:hypothetical protein